ncbi:MAG: tyrosine-type recombinase/integrase [Thermoguttaceae bacterium]
MLDLRGYVAALHEAGYAATTIARRLASLRSFFRFGLREGWVKTNPAKPLRNPRKPRSLPHFLSTEEIGRLLNAPSGSEPQGIRDRAILETMYSAGLRVSEVVGLNEADLDFEGAIFCPVTHKLGRPHAMRRGLAVEVYHMPARQSPSRVGCLGVWVSVGWRNRVDRTGHSCKLSACKCPIRA